MVEKPTYEELEQELLKLKKSGEERFRQLIKNSFDMIVLLDEKGIQHYVSESCEKILGFKPSELINIPVIDDFVHPDDQMQVKKAFVEILKPGSVGGATYRHRHKNGDWVYLEAFGSNQLNNKEIGAIILNVRDINKRKKAELALKENEAYLKKLNATKDKLFSIIAHDLKAPHNGIMGFSNLLLEEAEKGNFDQVINYTNYIRQSSQNAMDLLQNLLEWSQSQTGSIEFKPINLNLHKNVLDIVGLLADAARQKSIDVKISVDPLFEIWADKNMLHAILRNLLSNAIKFTHNKGQISLSAQKEEKHCIIAVKDNGVGIRSDKLPYLFSAEHQSSTPGTNNESGTGIGLLICRDFTEMHGGKIWVDSQEGKGACFRVKFPVHNKGFIES